MGLDKWIKTEDSEKKAEKKEVSRSKGKTKTQLIENKEETDSIKLTKFVLICSKPKCKYKKTIMKKELSKKDHLCPRCKNDMKVQ